MYHFYNCLLLKFSTKKKIEFVSVDVFSTAIVAQAQSMVSFDCKFNYLEGHTKFLTCCMISKDTNFVIRCTIFYNCLLCKIWTKKKDSTPLGTIYLEDISSVEVTTEKPSQKYVFTLKGLFCFVLFVCLFVCLFCSLRFTLLEFPIKQFFFIFNYHNK